MALCPCCSQKKYDACCKPYLMGYHFPETPESLMRSRYTAYTIANIDYIKQTMRGVALVGFQEIDAIRWAKKVSWIKLNVLDQVIEDATLGYVTFEAMFVEGSRLKSIHEKSKFTRDAERWYYIDGVHLPSSGRVEMVSRNMHCPCGSLRKFKNCHGR
jgi:SEC-C motif-containing protein